MLNYPAPDDEAGRPLPGPLRIIEAASGGHYCEECHEDIQGDDRHRDMSAVKRLLDGICGCCGNVIDNGEYAGHTR